MDVVVDDKTIYLMDRAGRIQSAFNRDKEGHLHPMSSKEFDKIREFGGVLRQYWLTLDDR